MGIDRRRFLKLAGASAALGLAGQRTMGMLTDAPAKDLPQEHPLTAKRWAMVIDLKKCHEQHDCTKCIDACHKVHNVPKFDNPKDEVKWIWKDKYEHAFLEQENEMQREDLRDHPVLLLCNHCDNPPCVSVCPTQATWKRDKDGVVMMDWHRCIGCRYCVAACPYGSRSFNWRDPRPFIEDVNEEYPTRMRGVVEKCTFCEERLAEGKIPSCVEVCPVKAMVFGDLEDPDSDVRRILAERFSIRRKPGLGTHPEIYYLV
jgi:Fe-S-cluster-containing dehydrogenase component